MAAEDSTAVILRKQLQQADREANQTAREWKPFGGLTGEELKRRQAEGKQRRKLLREVAQQIGGQYVCEYVDDFGRPHSLTRDELIVQKFAEELTKKPTAARILAWQRLKGEDVQQIARVDTISGKTTEELRGELNNLLAIINAAGGQTVAATAPAADQPQPQPREANTATDAQTGENIEVVEADEMPEATPRRLPWLG
jgi:hypothetical protein